MILKEDERLFSWKFCVLHFPAWIYAGDKNNLDTYRRLAAVIVILKTFYSVEYSLGPIMEILLLSYACNLPVPSQKQWSWIIKEDYFVLMHLIIMLSWWNK